MKKLFLLVAATICSAVSLSAATQYCQYPLEAADGTALLSFRNVSGNAYEVMLEAQDGMTFTAAYNVNCGVNQSAGAGILFANAGWVISDDKTTATFAFQTDSESSVPTTLYGNYMCFQKQGGTTARDLIEFQLGAITDIDWSAQCNLTPVEDEEAPVMGEAILVSNSWANAIIAVTATDNIGVRRYHVVDVANGLDQECTPKDGQITVKDLLPSTTYNLTITAKDAAGNESANSATVQVTTPAHLTAPLVAAPVPMHKAENVIAVYSDAYLVAEVWDYHAPWGDATIVEPTTLEGDNMFKITNLNYLGWACSGALNVSQMEKLHIDIWADEDGQMGIVPIYGGAGLATDDSHRKIVALVGQTWNSFDLELATDFPGLNLTSIFQFKFDQSQGNIYFLDNVYFFKAGISTAVENVQVNKVEKFYKDGQLMIVRDGVVYNAFGQTVR